MRYCTSTREMAEKATSAPAAAAASEACRFEQVPNQDVGVD
jgi:hypothetical protein